MSPSLRVYLCSTNRELSTERLLILNVLELLRKEYEGFTFFALRSQPSIEASLGALPGSDLAVFILAQSYGAVAPGLQNSPAELEFIEAQRLGIPTLAFLHDEEQKLLRHAEKNPHRNLKIQSFRTLLAQKECYRFTVAPMLASHLRTILTAEITKRNLPKRFLTRSLPKAPLQSGIDSQPGPTNSKTLTTQTIPLLQQVLGSPFSERMSRPRLYWLSGAAIVSVILMVAMGIGKWRFTSRLAPRASDEAQSTPLSQPVEDSLYALPLSSLSSTESTPVNSLRQSQDTLIVTQSEDSAMVALSQANSGDINARFALAERFESGRGFPRNDSLAFKYYLLAAKQKHSVAQYRVSILYLEGRGISRSPRQAKYWLLASSEQGYAKAQSKLGTMYLHGDKSSPRNPSQGFKWLLRAAENQDSTAKQILAELKEED